MFKIALCIILLSISGCASLHHDHHAHHISEPIEKISQTLKLTDMHEDCFELHEGDQLVYSFETTSFVDFNIHYHQDGNIFYPVIKENILSDKGSFIANKRDYYCLMWTNQGKEFVTITYTYTIKKREIKFPRIDNSYY